MNTFVIAGGNSGIGLQAARELLAGGHRVVMLGRSEQKGGRALESFGSARGRAVFCSVDLSTHDGVRAAARRIDEVTDRVDGLLHSAAVFDTSDNRTADGLPLFVALGYLSRYHLTQLLLPRLAQAEHPRVIMLTATFKEVPKLDPRLFPYFEPFRFRTAITQVNGACMYYADYLTKTHPKVFAGCATPGFVKTGLFDRAPWFVRAFAAVAGPFANSLETGAHNAVRALLDGTGPAALMWPEPGHYDRSFPITVDPAVQEAIINSSHRLTNT